MIILFKLLIIILTMFSISITCYSRILSENISIISGIENYSNKEISASYQLLKYGDKITENERLLDSLSLVGLYLDTDGDNWTNNSNWLTAEPIDNWFGVTVENDRVTKLDLKQNKLTGIIPPVLAFLSELKSLNLRNNSLNGIIPDSLGHLKKLEYLDLFYNNLTGYIPKEIGDLQSLIFLDVHQNNLTGPIPIEIGKLINLTKLNLSFNKLSDSIPKEVGNLTELIELDLSVNGFTGAIPPEIGNLINLIRLTISVCNLSGSIPSEIGNLTNLDYLNLSTNKITGNLPSTIGNLSKLKTLYLFKNMLYGNLPAELGNLKQLNFLDLHSNNFTGQIPAELSGLDQLSSLYLSQNQFSGNIPKELVNLDKLSFLWLHNNLLTGSIPSEIGNMKSLTKLFANNNQLDGQLPAGLGDCTKLEEIKLDSNGLTGMIPEEIKNLKNLTVLHLNNNKLSGELPSGIWTLTKMKSLFLEDNSFDGSLLNEIGNLKLLDSLAINSNNFSGAIPNEIINLSSLKVINIHHNDFNALPSLAGLTFLSELSINDNKFEFDDLERNLNLNTKKFIYSPQDSVGNLLDTILIAESNFMLDAIVRGSNNLYQWFKNGDSITTKKSSPLYPLNSLVLADSGEYVCHITNSIVDSLTLYTMPIIIRMVKKELYRVTFEIGSASASAGELIEIPIYLRNENFKENSTHSKFMAELVFNTSLLCPADSHEKNIIGNERRLSIELPTAPIHDSTLAVFKFYTALGNESSTELKLENIDPQGGFAIIETKNGIFSLEGICKEGGERLLNISSGNLGLTAASPNPVTGQLTVEFELIEKGLTKLFICNLQGEIIKTIFDENAKTGKYELNINLTDISSGTYFLLLQTPGNKKSIVFIKSE